MLVAVGIEELEVELVIKLDDEVVIRLDEVRMEELVVVGR